MLLDMPTTAARVIAFGLWMAAASAAIRLCPNDFWAAAVAGLVLAAKPAFDFLLRMRAPNQPPPDPAVTWLALAATAPLLGIGAWYWPPELTSSCSLCPRGSSESLANPVPFIFFQGPVITVVGLLAMVVCWMAARDHERLSSWLHRACQLGAVVLFCLLTFGLVWTRRQPEPRRYVQSFPAFAVLQEGDRFDNQLEFLQTDTVITLKYPASKESPGGVYRAFCDLTPPVSLHRDAPRGLWFVNNDAHSLAIEDGELTCKELSATWRWFDVRPSVVWFIAGFAGLIVLLAAQWNRKKLVLAHRELMAGREGRVDERGWISLEGEESPLLVEELTGQLAPGPFVILEMDVSASPYRAGQLRCGSAILSGTKADLSRDLRRKMIARDAMSVTCLIVPVCPTAYPVVASACLLLFS